MNKIEFIQECCKYADGFEISIMGDEEIGYVTTVDIEKLVSIGMGAILGDGDLESYNYWIKIYYPLLLIRTIEGINKNNKSLKIMQNPNKILIFDRDEYDIKLEYTINIEDNINQAKEEALEWVLEILRKRR